MNLPDVNVWLAHALSGHQFHQVARDWFSAQRLPKSTLFCRQTQQSLLRLLTTTAIHRQYMIPPITNTDAWKLVDDLLADARVGWSLEPAGVEARWKALTMRQQASSKMWMDAYLAAFAISGGYKLITTDKGFAQFPGLDLELLA